MKKKRTIHGCKSPWTKLFLVMRLSIFLLLAFVFAAQAKSFSQSTNLTLNLSKVKLIDVLNEIEEQTDYYFYFNLNLDDYQVDKIKAENQRVTDVLNQVLPDLGLDFEVVDRYIVIKKEDNPAKTNVNQQKSVSGKITDSLGMPLPGVTVIVKGTTQGTITDGEGSYSLLNIAGDATLVFSFIGMKTQEIPAAGKTVVDVVMEEDAIGIEEVIAIGYGTIKKQSVTGAVSSANLERFEGVPVNNVLESIKGSVPGLSISGVNRAGQVGSLLVRGQNTKGASNDPLVVVDGVIFGGSIADLPTNDIESFTVLKDASAAAVYGSRSANGVILIETKKGKGKSGKPLFDVKMSYGISNQLKPLELYDADGYIQRLLDIRSLNGMEANPAKVNLYLTEQERAAYESTSDHKATLTDPHSLFNQLGQSLNSTISVSNSTEKTNYYISASLVKQKGVMVNDEYKHISGRINIDSDLTDWFNIGVKASYSLKDYSGESPGFSIPVYNATRMSPYATIYNEDGTYKLYPQNNTFVNPFLQIATDEKDYQNFLSSVVTGAIKIPWIKGLTYNVTYSNSVSWKEYFRFYDENMFQGMTKKGLGEREYSRTYYMLLDNLIKYNRTFADKHDVDVTMLLSRESRDWENMGAYAEDFTNSGLGHYALASGSKQTVSSGGGGTDAIGMMARTTYTYNHKYSITGTVRRDGYSAFSKNKKWGVFPSVGLNWNISREGFMENVSAINNLALRLSYGKNGNQSIGAYSTLARIGNDIFLYNGDSNYTITQYIKSLANFDLGWETTTGLNMGLDFILLRNRISGSIDAYKTHTNDLMFDLALPTISGMSTIKSNIGEIRNKGFEINLNTINIERNEFKWYSDFAFSLNRNKVETILGEDNDGDGVEDDLISSGYYIGKSLNTIYDYKVIGMWQQADKDAGTIMDGMRPGDYKLEDVDGDGAITSDKDRQFIGSRDPNFRWSLTNTLVYKQFSLMFHLYSIWGGNDMYLSDNNTPYFDDGINSTDANHPVYDYWTPDNSGAEFPRPDYDFAAAYKGKKFFDRSFIKLQKVSLGYDASRIVKKYGVNGLRFSLSADNLATYAPHWVGLDPETNNGLTARAIPSIRTYLFSVSLNF